MLTVTIALSVSVSSLTAQRSHESHGAPDPSAPVLGVIDFPTSASPESHEAFVRGVLLMHNFHYPLAAKSFREAQHLDSTAVMGYWGEAMTYTHPVWNQQDTAKGRAVLRRLAPTREARLAIARNPREKQWLEAIEVLYQLNGTKAQRDTAYSLAMEKLHASDTTDIEATTFYALSLLGLNQGDRDVATYRKAYELVLPAFKTHPRHPGAAHYLIHAVDDPEHARLGLDAANAYSQIAPSAGHAIHMTSHIFLALGKWDDVVSANLRANATLPSGVLIGHGMHWLHYGLIEQGRYREADRWLDSTAKQSKSGRVESRADLAEAAGMMAAANIGDTRRWSGRAALIRLDQTVFNSDSYLEAITSVAAAEFGYALAALNRGDRGVFEAVLAGMEKQRLQATADPNKTTSRGMSEVMEKTLKAYGMMKKGNHDDALALFRDAASQEASLPMPFGPPVIIKPPREAAGELLLEMKRPEEAKAEFTLALARTPRRVAPLLGLARAEKALGNTDASRKLYAEILSIWHAADSDIPALAEVRGGSR